MVLIQFYDGLMSSWFITSIPRDSQSQLSMLNVGVVRLWVWVWFSSISQLSPAAQCRDPDLARLQGITFTAVRYHNTTFWTLALLACLTCTSPSPCPTNQVTEQDQCILGSELRWERPKRDLRANSERPRKKYEELSALDNLWLTDGHWGLLELLM